MNRQTNQDLFLVTFLRSGDASLFLSKIGAFKGLIHIKPDLSIEERSHIFFIGTEQNFHNSLSLT